MKTFNKLVDIFRVGRKVWVTNTTTIARFMACVAYNLEMGYSNENKTIAWTYSILKNDQRNLRLIKNGLKDPAFKETVMRLLMEDCQIGIICKRVLGVTSSGKKKLSFYLNKGNPYSFEIELY